MRRSHQERGGFRIRPQPLPPRVQQVVDSMHAADTDPEGSWTGIPAQDEQPVQDADDL